VLASIASIVLAVSCEHGGERQSGPAQDDTSTPHGVERVASLSPALTDMAIALGPPIHLVGCTPWCSVAGDVPVVGSLLDLDAETLVRLDPDIILVQPPAQGAPPELHSLAASHGWRVVSTRIDSLDDLGSAMGQVAHAIEPSGIGPCTDRARAWRDELVAACEPIPGAGTVGVVVVVTSLSDAGALAMGPGSFVADALEKMGLDCRTGQSMPYQQLSREDLVRLDADLLVVIEPAPGPGQSSNDTIVPGATAVFVIDPALLVPGARFPAALHRLRCVLEELAAARNETP